MRLRILDRLLLTDALPPQGDFATIKTIRVLREKLAATPEEVAQYSLVLTSLPNGSGYWSWNKAVSQEPFEIALTPSEVSACVTSLTRLNTEKKLTPEHVDLYEAFFPESAPKAEG